MNLNTTQSKIYLIFAGIAGFFVLFALLLLNQAVTVKGFSSEIESNWMPSIVAINAINTTTSHYRSAETLHILSTDLAEMDEYEQIMRRLTDDVVAWQSKYEPMISSDKERTLYQKFAKSYESYLVASKQAILLSQNNDKEKASNQIKRNGTLFNALSNDLLTLVELNSDGSIEAANQGAIVFEHSRIMIVVGGLLMISLMTFFAIMLGKVPIHTYDKRLIMAVKKKISWTFLTTITAVLLYSGVFYWQLTRVNVEIIELNTNWVPSIIVVNAINTKTSDYRIDEALHVLSTKADEMAQFDAELKDMSKDIALLRKKYIPMIASDYEKSLYSDFSSAYEEYMTTSNQVLVYSRANENDKAAMQLKQSSVLFSNFSSLLNDLVTLNKRGGIETAGRVDAALQSLKTTTIGGCTFVLVLLIISSQLVSSWLLDEPLDEDDVQSGTLMTVTMKLRLAFLGMVATFIAFSVIITLLMQTINQQTHELETNWLPSIIMVNAINSAAADYRIAEAQHILSTNDSDMLQWDKNIKRLVGKIAKARIRYEPMISSEEERGVYQNFSHKYDEYLRKSEKMLELSRKKDNANAAKELQHNRIMYDAFISDLVKLVDINSNGGTDAALLSKYVFQEAQQIMFAIVLTIFMLAFVFMIVFDKNISFALQRLTSVVNRLAEGVMVDTNGSFKNRHDEIGQMAKAVSVVTETLQALTTDANELIDAAKGGILSTRVEAQRHPGEFGKIVAGMNLLIELLSKPLTEVAHIMQNLALGDLAGRMEGHYEGELRILKANVNRSLDALVSLLTELIETMQYMANTDLTHSLNGNYQGEFSVLKANTNQTIVQMIEILKEITSSTSQAAAAITQTSEASKYVAKESSLQMFAVENVSKTIEETATSVNEIAQRAKQGSQLAFTTANLANEGQALLNKLIELIQHIDAEYGRIEQITDEITRIADKTHLLSLNAGLEAMRAGEHGLGFGFVAQQIGQLAEEVSTSARDIGAVISSSGQKVRLGVHATQETQAAMEQIAEAAKDNEQTVQGISAAIVQQSAAVKTLTERVAEIRVSSEANASAAEEISSTMSHLAQTVRDTAAQAKRFKLAD